MTALSSAALATLSASTPSYDRAAASVGIVHFGFGNFHRSHVAMYLDRLMESGQGLDWGICGVGVLEQDAAMRDVMHAQDCLFTLVVRHPDGSLEPRVVGSVLEYLYGPDDAAAVHRRLDDPAVRIVSLTVTEGGYLKNPAHRRLRRRQPRGGARPRQPEDPRTAFAYIVEGLRRRRDAGAAPFTVLSCDNLQGNGDYARQAVVGFARLTDPELATWIDTSVVFPNCMVDRITPSTTDADREAVHREFGIEDAVAGAGRALHPVDRRGRVPHRPTGAGVGRRAVRRRRAALRADEAAPAQREPPGDRLLRRPARLRAGRRGAGRRPHPHLPRALHGRRGGADARRAARHRPRAATWPP